MATIKTTKREPHINPIEGKKGRTYKVLIRKKGGTYCETFKKLTEAREARDKVLANTSRLGRPGTTFSEVAEQYASDYTGKDARFRQRLDYWIDLFGDWKLAGITRQVIAEKYHQLYRDPAMTPRRKAEPHVITREGATCVSAVDDKGCRRLTPRPTAR